MSDNAKLMVARESEILKDIINHYLLYIPNHRSKTDDLTKDTSFMREFIRHVK